MILRRLARFVRSFLLCGGAAAAISLPAVAADPPIVARATYAVEASERLALVSVDAAVQVLSDGWHAVRLLPSSIPLRDSKVEGERGYIARSGDRLVARLKGPGDYRIRLEYVVDVAGGATERSLDLPLLPAIAARIDLSIPDPDLRVETTPKLAVELSADGGKMHARIFPGTLDRLTIRWLPGPAGAKPEPIFEAVENSHVRLDSDRARRETTLALQVLRGELDGLTIGLPPGADLLGLSVTGAEVASRDLLDGAVRLRFRSSVSDRCRVVIRSEEVIAPESRAITLTPFAVEGATRQTGAFALSVAPALRAVATDMVNVLRADEASGARKTPLLRFEYHALPAEMTLALSSVPPRVAARVESFVRLQAGAAELAARLAYRIEDAAMRELRVGLEEGLIVLSVDGPELESWKAEGHVLFLRLKHPALGDLAFDVRCVENLRRMNGVLVPQVRCLDAAQEQGLVGVSAGDEVGLAHRASKKFIQIDTARLPDWIRAQQPKLAYLYDQPGGELAVATDLMRPALAVEVFDVAVIEKDAVREEIVFVCRVERRPIFALQLRLPEGLLPLHLVGPDVADWEYRADERSLTVTLKRALVGATQFRLLAERRLAPDATALDLGGVDAPESDDFSGWLAVKSEANLDATPTEARGLLAADVRAVPPILASYGKLQYAYRFSGADWSLACALAPVAARINAETRTALLFGAGGLRGRTEIRFHVANAREDEFILLMPPGAVNSQVSGPAIQAKEPIDGGWRVRLVEPVMGEATLTATYELLSDRRTGELSFGGVRLPQAERQAGTVAVYLEGPQLQVAATPLAGAQRADMSSDPEYTRYPSLGGFRLGDASAAIAFRMTGLALDRAVRLSAESCRLASVVKEQGETVQYMSCRVKNAGEQFFELRLPPGAKLWATYIQGAPVRPQRRDADTLMIPLLDAPRDRPFDLEVIWAEPTEPLGRMASLALLSPKLDLPAEKVAWDLYLPSEYDLVKTGGNMTIGPSLASGRRTLPAILWQRFGQFWERAATTIIILIVLGAIALAVGLIGRAQRRAMKRRAEEIRRAREAGEEPKFVPLRRRFIEVAVIIVILFVLAGLLMPAGSRAREASRQAASSGNLKQIGDAIIGYLTPSRGFTPPSLDALYPTHIDNLSVFTSPMDGQRYEYGGMLDIRKASADTPLAWEAPNSIHEGISVVFADGHVEWLDLSTDKAREEALNGNMRVPAERYIASLTEREGYLASRIGSKEIGVQAEAQISAGETVTDDLQEKTARKQIGRRLEETQQAARVDRYGRAMQLGESYANLGKFDEAEEQFRTALNYAPGSQDAKDRLERLRRKGPALPEAAAPAPAEEAKKEARYGASSLAVLADKLNSEAPADWRYQVADTDRERDLLDLVSGKKKSLDLGKGGSASWEGGDIVIRGNADQVADVERAAGTLRDEMVAASREISKEKQRQAAEQQARRRIQLKLREMASVEAPRKGGGTLAENRAAGATPLPIRFPSVGTRAYPFELEFAGLSQARIEVTCLRRGPALLFQGLIGLAALVGASVLGRRKPLIGLAAAILITVGCIAARASANDAADPYLVMGIIGAGASLPVLFAIWAIRKASQGHGNNERLGGHVPSQV